MHGYIYTLSYPKNPTEKIIIAHGYNIIYPKNSEYKIKSVENVMQKEFFKINNIQIKGFQIKAILLPMDRNKIYYL